jgi:transposase, IS30 family
VSTETIYQSLYVQSRGALKLQLTRYLRTGRSLRKPGRMAGQRKNRMPDMVNSAERPAEADDRAVPSPNPTRAPAGPRCQSGLGTDFRFRVAGAAERRSHACRCFRLLAQLSQFGA